MSVVSNTTPINYLILIGEIDLAAGLYGGLVIPPAVCSELQAPLSPASVQAWAASPPAWLAVQAPTARADPGLSRLQAGEREAILLAAELRADLLLLDERAGQREGRARGLRVAGTVAVLMDGGWQGPIDFEDALNA